jgi:hypothetical protein
MWMNSGTCGDRVAGEAAGRDIIPRGGVRCILAACSLLATSACEGTGSPNALRQGTPSYLLSITVPATPPVVQDDVTYVISVRDRSTGQPIETGEGRLFARSAEQIVSPLIKAPQVGQYRATVRFPHAGAWMLGIRFREPRVKELELTQWGQLVRSTNGAEEKTAITPPWRWSRPRSP